MSTEKEKPQKESPKEANLLENFPKEINCEITVELLDEDGKPEKPRKPMTIDNGLLPWGSLFLVSMIVMFGTFAYLCFVVRLSFGAVFACFLSHGRGSSWTGVTRFVRWGCMEMEA